MCVRCRAGPVTVRENLCPCLHAGSHATCLHATCMHAVSDLRRVHVNRNRVLIVSLHSRSTLPAPSHLDFAARPLSASREGRETRDRARRAAPTGTDSAEREELHVTLRVKQRYSAGRRETQANILTRFSHERSPSQDRHQLHCLRVRLPSRQRSWRWLRHAEHACRRLARP
jgi:hypothetical protein